MINNPAQRGRIRFFDIARGIAIICIILGHFSITQLTRFVFTFHVPIFYLITGYFISDRDSVWDFTKKRIRTLIVPYYVTCAAIVILSVVMNELILHWGDSKEIAVGWIKAALYGAGDKYSKPFPIKAIGAIWFLWATFWSSLFLRVSLKLKPVLRLVFVLLLFAAGNWSRKAFFWFPLSIQAGCSATLFLYIGYLGRQVEAKYREFPFEAKAAWSVFALIVWIFFIRDFESFWLVHCDVGRGAVDIFGSLCACYTVMLISKWLDRHGKCVATFFAFLGENSIFMLCAHIVELDLVPWYVLQDMLYYDAGVHPYLCLAIIVLCKIVWAVTVTAVFAKWNVTCRLFGMRVK